MSFYDSNEGATDSEKKLKNTTAFEEDSVLDCALGDALDPKSELSFDLQQLLSAVGDSNHVHGVGEGADQLFPDLLATGPDSFNLGQLPVHQHGSLDSLDVSDAVTASRFTTLSIPDNGPPKVHHRVTTSQLGHMPQIVQIDLPKHLVGLTANIKAEPDSTLTQQVAVIESSSLDEAIDQAGATLLDLPLAISEVASPADSVSDVSTSARSPGQARPRRGRLNTRKATPPSKNKKSLDKESLEYKERRERNNIAVRKSRDKAKLKQLETNSRVQDLTDKNNELQKKVDLLTKELNVLKGLFSNIGASVPQELREYFARQEQ